MKAMKRSIKVIFLIFLLATVMTGCWNNRDLTDLAIVAGLAVDKTDDNKIEITVQIVKPSEIKHSEGGNGKEKKPYINVTSQGETMFDAIRNLLSILNKKAYFPHVQLMVISEEAAREGLSDYFDFYERDVETRRRADVVIAKGMKAKTVLDSESRLSVLPATHNVEALEASKAFAKSIKVTLLDILKNFSQEGQSIALPILYTNKSTDKLFQEDLLMEGAAVIKRDRLVGFLDPLQTRGLLFALDEVDSTIINFPNPNDPKKRISIEVIRSKGKIDAKMAEGKPVLEIEVAAEGNIGDLQGNFNPEKGLTMEMLEQETEKTIESEIRDILKITQQVYESDVFGFAGKLEKNYYPEWKKIAPDWSRIFSRTPVNIKVKFEIRRPGLIKENSRPK
ncbi:MAG: Ger(x)C family spore germination protein [Clostridia bacterium]|nr:Ger(x)C family spore germination protein [Clostridia bacterium]